MYPIIKKTINGVTYDTSKAKLITHFIVKVKILSFLGDHYDWVKGELYQTQSGQWFNIIGRDRKGTRVNLLTENEAFDILRKVNPEIYQELFQQKI